MRNFEKRTKTSYEMINFNHWFEVYKERKRRGLNRLGGSGDKTRTYDKIPKHEIFNFLRKAFEECKWTKIKKFKMKKSDSDEFEANKEYHVDCVYFDYELCGYVLKVLYHEHYDKDNPSAESHGVIVVKDINCLEPINYVIDMNNIEIMD